MSDSIVTVTVNFQWWREDGEPISPVYLERIGKYAIELIDAGISTGHDAGDLIELVRAWATDLIGEEYHGGWELCRS